MKLTLALAGLLLFAGCNKDDGPVLVDVTGTVTLDDQPLDGAAVVFVSSAGGPSQSAVTGADGKFQTKSIPGSCMIGVSKVDMGGLKIEQTSDGGSPANMEQLASKVKYIVPLKFGDPKTSGLTVTIPEAGGDLGAIKVTAK